MSPRARHRGRTQACGDREARAKLRRAEQFVEVATLLKEESDPDWASAAAALAVLAGISASDAACCKALGLRARGQDHHDAEALLEQIDPGGKHAATAMRRLINLKDEAHYGFYSVSRQDLKAALTQAGRLVRFARAVLARE
jgi:HEPN domain-containing protein